MRYLFNFILTNILYRYTTGTQVFKYNIVSIYNIIRMNNNENKIHKINIDRVRKNNIYIISEYNNTTYIKFDPKGQYFSSFNV